MSVISLKPVAKRSAESLTVHALRNHILSGGVRPGERLTEIGLSEQLAVSRATVRTALHHLSQEGLITQIPYTGWQVMDLDPHDVWELYTLRSSLEGLAAKLVAQSINERVAAAIREAFGRLASICESGSIVQIADADFQLHKTIIDLTKHLRLANQYLLIEQQIRLYIASSDALVPHADVLVEQHRPIVTAILDGDAETAARLSEAHNTTEGRILVAHLEKKEAAKEEP